MVALFCSFRLKMESGLSGRANLDYRPVVSSVVRMDGCTAWIKQKVNPAFTVIARVLHEPDFGANHYTNAQFGQAERLEIDSCAIVPARVPISVVVRETGLLLSPAQSFCCRAIAGDVAAFAIDTSRRSADDD